MAFRIIADGANKPFKCQVSGGDVLAGTVRPATAEETAAHQYGLDRITDFKKRFAARCEFVAERILEWNAVDGSGNKVPVTADVLANGLPFSYLQQLEDQIAGYVSAGDDAKK